MIKADEVKLLVEQAIADSDIFLVEVTVAADNRIEVSLDSLSGVSIDDCVRVSRSIEGGLDREVEDYELTVASAGLGQPLKVLRQYEKCLGCEVEVLLKNGLKLKGILGKADAESITLEYEAKELLEGKKRKQMVVKTEQLLLENIKTTKQVVHVK